MLHKDRTDTEENRAKNPQDSGIRKKIILFCLLGCAFAFCAVLALTCCAHGPAEFSPAVNRHPKFSATVQENADRTELKLMTLNMAHGRKDGFSQIFQTEKELLSHLDEIADVLKRENRIFLLCRRRTAQVHGAGILIMWRIWRKKQDFTFGFGVSM